MHLLFSIRSRGRREEKARCHAAALSRNDSNQQTSFQHRTLNLEEAPDEKDTCRGRYRRVLPSVSYAATLNFPSDAPIASITIPDYWGTKGMQEQHGPELQAIIASLKPAEYGRSNFQRAARGRPLISALPENR